MLTSIQNILLEERLLILSQLNALSQASWYQIVYLVMN